MPRYRVTFKNHIVETYIVDAADEAAAWETDPEDVEDLEPDRWDCTMCEVTDVQRVTRTNSSLPGRRPYREGPPGSAPHSRRSR
jgi:hypothetical protein